MNKFAAGALTASFGSPLQPSRRIISPVPAPATAFPWYWINYTQAAGFALRLTAFARKTGVLPPGREFRLPAEGTPNGDGTFSRVRRGGGFSDDGNACRSARRHRFEPERSADHIGFRVLLQPAG